MSSSIRVREYLESRGCARHVVDGGIDYLLDAWDHISSHPDSDRYEYLNDLDGRAILEEVLALFPSSEIQEIRDRVKWADARFVELTNPSDTCVWGAKVAADRGYNSTAHWWYFRAPKVRDDSWD